VTSGREDHIANVHGCRAAFVEYATVAGKFVAWLIEQGGHTAPLEREPVVHGSALLPVAGAASMVLAAETDEAVETDVGGCARVQLFGALRLTGADGAEPATANARSRALEQDPVHGRNYAFLSTLRLNSGDIEGAVAAGQRMTDLGFPSMWHALAIYAAGDHERAIETYRQTRRLMNTVIFPPAGTEAMSDAGLDAFGWPDLLPRPVDWPVPAAPAELTIF
jgi:hypothetical protein